MNLLEFKKFCLGKQNWNFVFVEANGEESVITDAKVIPKLEPDVYKTNEKLLDEMVDFADVTLKDDINIVLVKFYENVSSFIKTEALNISLGKGKLDNRYIVEGKIVNNEITNIKKANNTEYIYIGLGIESKNEIVVNTSKLNTVYQLFAKNLKSLNANNIGKVVNLSEDKFLSQLSLITTLKSCGFILKENILECNIILPDTVKITTSNWKTNFEIEISKPDLNLINSLNIIEDRYLTKLNVLETKNKDINLPIKNINSSFINIGRKAYLYDYQNESLIDMSINNQNLKDKNYIIN